MIFKRYSFSWIGALALGIAPVAGFAQNPPFEEDPNALERARKHVAQIGIQQQGKCSSCHSATLTQAEGWYKAASTVKWCLGKAKPEEKPNCLRADPKDPSSPFSARTLGFYAAGAHLGSFRKIFEEAHPGDPEAAFVQHREFLLSAAMPPLKSTVAPFSPEDAEEIVEWALLGLPLARAVVRPDPERPCVPYVAPLRDHLVTMSKRGWGVTNAINGLAMFGCEEEGWDARKCLARFPEETEKYAAPGVAQTLRRLHDRPTRSSYWFRASPDGRYLGFGGGYGETAEPAALTDLELAAQPGAASTATFKDAVDPQFLPDGTGFAFTGLEKPVQSLCRMSLLPDLLARPQHEKLDLRAEAKCTSKTDGWYESWGASLDAKNSYWMIAATFSGDDGQYNAGNPIPIFSVWDPRPMVYTELLHDGLAYKTGKSISATSLKLLDIILSPSGRIISGRFGANGVQNGFELRRVEPVFGGEGASISFPKVGEVCGYGGKASFSFDERFLVTHQYVEPWRPDSPAIPADTSNIVVMDLWTGKSTRITEVPAGYHALFPNFRSDGWIYFLLRSPDDKSEAVLASDFALRAAAEQPLQ
jgi:hypothetical protein